MGEIPGGTDKKLSDNHTQIPTGITQNVKDLLASREIENSNAGEGLIFYGSTIVPFKDDFPKDTMLYRYMTTKPEETLQN